jgi:predicted transcriptional regulator
MTDLSGAPVAPDYLRLTASIVSAYVRQNSVAVDGLPAMIGSIHRTLTALGNPYGLSLITDKAPAVPIKNSIAPDYIVCLEDGKRLKMLKRYIRARFKLSPDEYRKKWGLPHDYPMVAANYAKRRSDLAKQSGLGRVGKPTSKKRFKK